MSRSPSAREAAAAAACGGAGEGRPLVTADALTYTYPDGSPALRALSLEAREGERLALLGPNGSGKSTLLRLLAADRTPGIGRAAPVDGARARWLAPDQPAFRSWLSGRENAVVLLELHGARGAEARATADAWLARFGLAEDADRSAGAYSSGMRRRLALAVAFGAGVPLLLLDEPLAGLDPGGCEAFAEALAGHREGGGTSVLSAHDPDFAEAHCDRVAFIVDGRCEVADTPARLLARVGARPLVEIRFGGAQAPDRESLGSAPDSVLSAAWTEAAVTLEVADPRSALPETLAWALGGNAAVASVDVRNPGLADAFVLLTGRRLEEGDE